MNHEAKIIPSVNPGQAILRCSCGRSEFVSGGHGKYVCACGAVAVVKGEEPVAVKADAAPFLVTGADMKVDFQAAEETLAEPPVAPVETPAPVAGPEVPVPAPKPAPARRGARKR